MMMKISWTNVGDFLAPKPTVGCECEGKLTIGVFFTGVR